MSPSALTSISLCAVEYALSVTVSRHSSVRDTGIKLCEYIGHLRYIWVKKIGRTRALAANVICSTIVLPITVRCVSLCYKIMARGCANAALAAMPPPRAAHCALRPERAALALWVTPVHASSMVESTADTTTLPLVRGSSLSCSSIKPLLLSLLYWIYAVCTASSACRLQRKRAEMFR